MKIGRHLHAFRGWYVIRYADCPCWEGGWTFVPRPVPR